MARSTLPIAQYALIGDRHTAALVGSNGSIDWLCLPRFDSAACFAALLGDDEHGFWQFEPLDDYQVSRRYVGDSGVLETTFTTETGVVTLTDVMPLGADRNDLVRRINGVEGSVRMHHTWVARFGYGKVLPWVRRTEAHGERVIEAIAGPDRLVLRGPRLPAPSDHRHTDEFTVEADDRLTFSTTWTASYDEIPSELPGDDLDSICGEDTEEWVQACREDLPHRDLVTRSLITLKQLTHERSGGIIAAPTTSLPEEFGGERNWDYRFCWLRDASLTLDSLITAGHLDEAHLWRGWLLRAVAGDPADLQIMYTVDGGRDIVERTLDHLPGYRDSAPVRVGNGAVGQRQTDVLGEVMIALDHARREGAHAEDNAWQLQRALVNELAKAWQEPDNGIWEIRGPCRHFTHSRVMVWAAFDRAVRGVEEFDLPGEVEEWREIRDRVREEVLTRGFDEATGSFVQHYDTDEVDAALLVLPQVGFVDGDDPRMLGTIARIESELRRDGLVLRYRTASGVDGLEGDEHPFLACSFWLVQAYALAGRLTDAEVLFDRLAGLANDVGLLSEEYDVGHGAMAGNFPQAFSHLALVRAAFAIADARDAAG